MFRITLLLYALMFQVLSLLGLKTVAELLAAAKAAILDGNVDEGERLKNQAVALKSIEDLEASAAVKAAPPVQRLDLTASDPNPTERAAPAEDLAAKTWFVKKYGDPDAGMVQIARELYGGSGERADFVKLSHLKARAFSTYLKTGTDPQGMARVLLLSPGQIAGAFADGATVGEIKTTMIESQDTLGKHTCPCA